MKDFKRSVILLWSANAVHTTLLSMSLENRVPKVLAGFIVEDGIDFFVVNRKRA